MLIYQCTTKSTRIFEEKCRLITIRRTNQDAVSYLYDSLPSSDFEDLTLPALTVAKLDVDNLGVSESQKNRHSERVLDSI